MLNLPEDIDLDALSSLLPDTPLTNPDPDTVISLYRFLLAHVAEADAVQREVEELRAESERKDVELDQALQDRDTATKELEATLEATQKELQQVKEENSRLATTNKELQRQIATLSNSQSSSSTEVLSLRQRVEDVEREKRDLVLVVSRLKEDGAQREEEIQTLRTNLRQARQEHQTLEAQLREARSSETSTKFKIDSLSQQLTLAKEELERTSGELSAKTEEFARYRRAKHAELAQLQAEHDALTQTHASTESTLKALQSAHSAQTHQLAQAQARIQELTGALAEQEANYSTEAGTLKRLVKMLEEREQQSKVVVANIERDWAEVGEKTAQRENHLREIIDKERKRAEQAEKRVEELEEAVQRMPRGEQFIPSISAPGTPQTPGIPGTPVRGGISNIVSEGSLGWSPSISMAGRMQRSGKTFTEVYADYVQLQEQYAQKCAECEKLDDTVRRALSEIEERVPVLNQQREEYERLRLEADELASQLAETIAERDAKAAQSEDSSQKLRKVVQENGLLQTQLKDLGDQVQNLLEVIARKEDPLLEAKTREKRDTVPAANIEEVITDNLVLFDNIGALQEQNMKLLKITRELGQKLEDEERDYRAIMEQEQLEAIKEAHDAIQELQDQLDNQKRSHEITLQAYIRERDALRARLSRAERGLPTTYGDLPAPTSFNGKDADLAKELAEVQHQFDTYRTEMGVDVARLREETFAAQKEAHRLSAELAKANAKVDYLADRHRMAQEQYAIQNRELDSLNTRNRQLLDQYTRVDIECNRVSEDLAMANSRVEQLRNENANLRAEKKIWESVQARLVEDNKSLAMERSQLSDLMVNVQRMHHDLEQSGQNDRRRLENQIQTLERQTEDLRSQLAREREAVRHLSLQKDVELKELQTRLDKALEDLSKTRESLVGAETSNKHFQERLDDLTRQLQGNEEKLAVYERRSSAVNGIAHHADENLSREQQLEAEVAELRSALKVAEVDLANARSHVQQFQEISQANENALASLSATHDEFKASSEAEIAKLESDCNALREQLNTTQQELRTANEKLAEVQQTFASERTAWLNDKKTLEDAIIDITNSEQTSESDRTSRENEVRELEARIKAAEEKYAREVVAHADTIKHVEDLRKQLAGTQSAIRDSQAAAETAQAKLATSEDSWKHQKEALDKEVADLNVRCRELAAQNSILHQHLESVTTQAAQIRQAASEGSAFISVGEGDAADNDVKLAELRSVVSYLRKEKEIVDLQLELSKQENLRLKTQVEHLTQQLENTRAALSDERERAVQAAASEAQHAELVERINQLTILRESNATLRADCEAQTRRANQLDAQLRELSAQLEPALEDNRTLHAELEARDLQIKRLEEESRRWQERNAQLLSKYDRIDPAEMQSLKEEIVKVQEQKAELEQAIATLEQEKSELQKRVEEIDTRYRNMRETGSKNNQIYKQRFAQWKDEKTKLDSTVEELQNQIKTLTDERDALQSQGAAAAAAGDSAMSEQLEALRQEKSALEAALADAREKAGQVDALALQIAEQTTVITTLREERDRLLIEKESLSAAIPEPGSFPDLDAARSQWDNEKAELVKARDAAEAAAEAAAEQAKKASEEANNIRSSNEKFQARIQELQKARLADSQRASAQQEAAVAAAVEQAKGEFSSSSTSEEVASQHAEELRALEERLRAQFQEELKAAVSAAKAEALSESASGSDVDRDAAIAAALREHEEKLREHHAQEIAQAVERGRQEQAIKGKIKDQQLVRAQTKLRDLEAQILEWKKAGLVPEESTPGSAATTPARPAAVSTATTASTSAPTAPAAAKAGVATRSATAANQTGPSTSTSAAPARKPSMGGPAAAPAEGAGRGRGVVRGGGAARGAARGGLNIRGAAPGRGGAPAAAAAAASTSAGGGVSIMGAAGKRVREDGEGAAGDDALAKRLKPADTPAASKPPVKLRRDGGTPST
ncbi:hypothetical protein GLOTRDRAFT_66309 [Gloeophyllum trabeum ATCC 11539]|uniref:Uncharacterized protein n=1 Tax=Gloeophyllum trabeum (strain ATCC 11539 / FP-39264 / Madison 617) TaxID=670483 RepID=S7RF28_GLOTA|nr:uncharacterized protein GLOTRDRAFT_66309 [Gloeophyllum trabeum ATCC 11539]EPQ51089.1 hypothetical protein GLOTRDRAFT_66309 [Gloeophyllum trabeum ATCC 11539]